MVISFDSRASVIQVLNFLSRPALRWLFSFVFFFTESHLLHAQADSAVFRSPLDIPLTLAGTFGEIRVSHFHSGIDIRTNGKEGLPVYAVADGYVSRIKISRTAYGKAIYINHPNGYTTVYAHLQKFSSKIEKQIRTIQYQKESFEVDEYFPAAAIPVRRGEVIALSGNSGKSFAPHLHFEVRDSETEHPLNPLAFLPKLADNSPPLMKDLFIYKADECRGRMFPIKEKIVGKNGFFELKSDTVRLRFQKVGFGINAYDANGLGAQNGIYELTMRVDGKPMYHFVMNEISFDETRYVQAHMDYRLNERDNIKVHRLFRLPGNYFSHYDSRPDNGMVTLDTAVSSISITVSDYSGNVSSLNFFVMYDSLSSPPDFSAIVYDTLFDYREDNLFQRDEVKVFLPKNTCYDSIYFNYEKLSNADSVKIFSSVHQIHLEEEPAHLYFTVAIQPCGLPDKLKSKALIIRETEKPDEPEPKESSWDGAFLKARTRDFGKYYIVADTTPPKIEPLNIFDNKVVTAQSSIQIKVTDDISGIKSYRGTVDGKWILMEYDEKNDLLTYFFDWRTDAGEHVLALHVSDAIGNQSVLRIRFVR